MFKITSRSLRLADVVHTAALFTGGTLAAGEFATSGDLRLVPLVVSIDLGEIGSTDR